MLGLSVALLVYLHPELVPARDPPPAAASVDPPRPPEPGPAGRPRFDFYTILPEREVKVPEWEAAPPPAEPKPAPAAAAQAPPKAAGPYMIQVGSFQRYQDADRVKAKLALAGVSAGIQRVVINGSDVWYRVRIGPFGDLASLQGTRQRLTEGRFNYMLVRVKPGEGAG
jgi:cell division protein FtsN